MRTTANTFTLRITATYFPIKSPNALGQATHTQTARRHYMFWTQLASVAQDTASGVRFHKLITIKQ